MEYNMLTDLQHRMLMTWQSGFVERTHTTPTLGSHSVGRHSHGAAVLLLALYPECSKALLAEVLMHDAAEHYVGDTPWPARKRFSMLEEGYEFAETVIRNAVLMPANALTQRETEWLSAVDILDLFLFSHHQLIMGNGYFAPIVQNARKIIAGGWVPEPVKQFAMHYTIERQNGGKKVLRDSEEWWFK
jgi:hypothetical protein